MVLPFLGLYGGGEKVGSQYCSQLHEFHEMQSLDLSFHSPVKLLAIILKKQKNKRKKVN